MKKIISRMLVSTLAMTLVFDPTMVHAVQTESAFVLHRPQTLASATFNSQTLTERDVFSLRTFTKSIRQRIVRQVPMRLVLGTSVVASAGIGVWQWLSHLASLTSTVVQTTAPMQTVTRMVEIIQAVKLQSGWSPWKVAEVVYGNGSLYQKVIDANPGAHYQVGDWVNAPVQTIIKESIAPTSVVHQVYQHPLLHQWMNALHDPMTWGVLFIGAAAIGLAGYFAMSYIKTWRANRAAQQTQLPSYDDLQAQGRQDVRRFVYQKAWTMLWKPILSMTGVLTLAIAFLPGLLHPSFAQDLTAGAEKGSFWSQIIQKKAGQLAESSELATKVSDADKKRKKPLATVAPYVTAEKYAAGGLVIPGANVVLPNIPLPHPDPFKRDHHTEHQTALADQRSQATADDQTEQQYQSIFDAGNAYFQASWIVEKFRTSDELSKKTVDGDGIDQAQADVTAEMQRDLLQAEAEKEAAWNRLQEILALNDPLDSGQEAPNALGPELMRKAIQKELKINGQTASPQMILQQVAVGEAAEKIDSLASVRQRDRAMPVGLAVNAIPSISFFATSPLWFLQNVSFVASQYPHLDINKDTDTLTKAIQAFIKMRRDTLEDVQKQEAILAQAQTLKDHYSAVFEEADRVARAGGLDRAEALLRRNQAARQAAAQMAAIEKAKAVLLFYHAPDNLTDSDSLSSETTLRNLWVKVAVDFAAYAERLGDESGKRRVNLDDKNLKKEIARLHQLADGKDLGPAAEDPPSPTPLVTVAFGGGAANMNGVTRFSPQASEIRSDAGTGAFTATVTLQPHSKRADDNATKADQANQDVEKTKGVVDQNQSILDQAQAHERAATLTGEVQRLDEVIATFQNQDPLLQRVLESEKEELKAQPDFGSKPATERASLEGFNPRAQIDALAARIRAADANASKDDGKRRPVVVGLSEQAAPITSHPDTYLHVITISPMKEWVYKPVLGGIKKVTGWIGKLRPKRTSANKSAEPNKAHADILADGWQHSADIKREFGALPDRLHAAQEAMELARASMTLRRAEAMDLGTSQAQAALSQATNSYEEARQALVELQWKAQANAEIYKEWNLILGDQPRELTPQESEIRNALHENWMQDPLDQKAITTLIATSKVVATRGDKAARLAGISATAEWSWYRSEFHPNHAEDGDASVLKDFSAFPNVAFSGDAREKEQTKIAAAQWQAGRAAAEAQLQAHVEEALINPIAVAHLQAEQDLRQFAASVKILVEEARTQGASASDIQKLEGQEKMILAQAIKERQAAQALAAQAHRSLPKLPSELKSVDVPTVADDTLHFMANAAAAWQLEEAPKATHHWYHDWLTFSEQGFLAPLGKAMGLSLTGRSFNIPRPGTKAAETDYSNATKAQKENDPEYPAKVAARKHYFRLNGRVADIRHAVKRYQAAEQANEKEAIEWGQWVSYFRTGVIGVEELTTAATKRMARLTETRLADGHLRSTVALFDVDVMMAPPAARQEITRQPLAHVSTPSGTSLAPADQALRLLAGAVVNAPGDRQVRDSLQKILQSQGLTATTVLSTLAQASHLGASAPNNRSARVQQFARDLIRGIAFIQAMHLARGLSLTPAQAAQTWSTNVDVRNRVTRTFDQIRQSETRAQTMAKAGWFDENGQRGTIDDFNSELLLLSARTENLTAILDLLEQLNAMPEGLQIKGLIGQGSAFKMLLPIAEKIHEEQARQTIAGQADWQAVMKLAMNMAAAAYPENDQSSLTQQYDVIRQAIQASFNIKTELANAGKSYAWSDLAQAIPSINWTFLGRGAAFGPLTQYLTDEISRALSPESAQVDAHVIDGKIHVRVLQGNSLGSIVDATVKMFPANDAVQEALKERLWFDLVAAVWDIAIDDRPGPNRDVIIKGKTFVIDLEKLLEWQRTRHLVPVNGLGAAA